MSGSYVWWGEFTGAVRFRMLWHAPPRTRVWFPWAPAPVTDPGPDLAFSTNDGPLAWNLILGPGCRCNGRAARPTSAGEGGAPPRSEGRPG